MNPFKSALVALLGLVAMTGARAELPGRHPAYIHALSDLRAARWMLQHRPDEGWAHEHQEIAIREIEIAIAEMRQAAIYDGKDLDDHPRVDAPSDGRARLHEALRLLMAAHHDADQEEDDPAARGLKHRTLEHLDRAIHEVERSINDVERRE